jgi:hypothetical protein
MSDHDLTRVRADLATIKEAAGIKDGPRREDIVTNCLVALAGLCAALWTLLAHGSWHVWGLSAVLIPVGYMIHVRLRNGAAQGGSPQVRSEFSESLRILLLAIPFSVYAFWALRMGIPPKLVLATCLFFVGMLMAGALIGTVRHVEVLPYCAILMIVALALPATSLSPVLVLGLMIAGSGLTSALILRSRLRSVVKHGLTD